MLTKEGRLEQDLCSLLEGALAEGSTIDAVDAVARNRGEDAPLSHHVDQGAQVPVVHIDIVSTQNHAQLLDETVPSCLDTERL